MVMQRVSPGVYRDSITGQTSRPRGGVLSGQKRPMPARPAPLPMNAPAQGDGQMAAQAQQLGPMKPFQPSTPPGYQPFSRGDVVSSAMNQMGQQFGGNDPITTDNGIYGIDGKPLHKAGWDQQPGQPLGQASGSAQGGFPTRRWAAPQSGAPMTGPTNVGTGYGPLYKGGY